MAQVKRPTRAPINGVRMRTKIKNQEPGYHYRLVNDLDDRVQEMIERGYEVVSDNSVSVGDKRVANPAQEGSPVSVSVGNGVKGVVMRIKDEWWEEDKTAHDAKVRATEDQIKRDLKENNFYGDVSIKR